MERHEIRPAAWKMAGLVVLLIGFTVLGGALVVYGEGVVAKAAGALCVVFFGGLGSLALYARSKGQGRLAVLPRGLEYAAFSHTPRVIPWSDIETIGTLKVANQEFTAIRLRNYDALIGGLSDEEADKALKQFGAMRALGAASVAVGFAGIATGAPGTQHVGDVMHFIGGSGKVKSLAEMLQFMRQKYGAELCLGWNLRDRGAKEFANYLEECRRRAATPSR